MEATTVKADKTSDVSSASCVYSDHGTASEFCADCCNYYCETCSISHGTSPSLSGHIVMVVSEMSPGDIKLAKTPKRNTCTVHWLPLTHFCKKCRELICTTCCLYKHMEHDVGRAVVKNRKKIPRAYLTADIENSHGIVCVKPDHGCASAFCRDCTSFFCETCTALHQTFDSINGHNITSINKMSSLTLNRPRTLLQKTLVENILSHSHIIALPATMTFAQHVLC